MHSKKLGSHNEHVSFNKMGNYSLDTFFGHLKTKILIHSKIGKEPKLLHFTQITDKVENKVLDPKFWTLYFDGSKSKEGAGVGYILTDPQRNKTLIDCRLNFKCNSNTIEYEALIQSLNFLIDMNVDSLEVWSFKDYF